jgi:hypothetical protein
LPPESKDLWFVSLESGARLQRLLKNSTAASLVSGHDFSRAVSRTLMIRGFSLCRLAMREIPETERKLLRRICQTFLYRILRDVFSMPQQAIVILDSNIGKSALPNFARKSPFDKLYGRLDGNFFINSEGFLRDWH